MSEYRVFTTEKANYLLEHTLNPFIDHLAYDDNLFGNLFGADDPMTPQIEFRGGNGHTSKTIVIRSGSFFSTLEESHFFCEQIYFTFRSEITPHHVRLDFNACFPQEYTLMYFAISSCSAAKVNHVLVRLISGHFYRAAGYMNFSLVL